MEDEGCLYYTMRRERQRDRAEGRDANGRRKESDAGELRGALIDGHGEGSRSALGWNL
jgi:hypothetical protein